MKRSILVNASLAVVLLVGLVAIFVSQQQVSAAATGPCDIYASGGTPCVAAHSTVRALYGSYNGRLYQVRRSNGQTMDINTLEEGGFADAAAQDSFCSGTSCVITIIYDQSGRGNHLTPAPAGGVCGADDPANATALPLTVGGHNVYGVYVTPGIGYRDNTTSGIATGDQPEGMYAVLSGTHYNNQCCFDYGNAETNNLDNGNGHMEAIYFGNCTFWGHGSGSGPWVMADLENGLFAGGSLVNNNNTSLNYNYVTAIVKGEPNHFAIRAGNAQSGGLTTMWDGARPTTSGYNPMHKEGAIILGIGGDNSCSARGSFFEGAMTSGYPSDSTENAVQANIVAAGYGYSGPTPTPPPAQQDPIVWYKFDGNANDSSGNGHNASLSGGSYVSGHDGQAVSLDGSNDYVSLPTGIVSNLGDFSIATWVRLDSIGSWSRVFDFGTGTSVNMFLTPQNGSSNVVRFAITTNGNSNEQIINGSSALPTGSWTHVAVTKSGNTGRLYVNGSQVGSNSSMTLSPSSLGNTNQNWIGRSQYSADPYLDGAIDDFRIYNRALSASEVSNLASGGITPTSTPPPSSSTYQAEDATLGGGVSVDTNHSGYYGTGFVNFPSSGGYVEYRNVDGGSGGSRTLVFRFALGASSARTGQLTVNGSSQNITFQPTGSWDSWNTMNVTVNLNAGTSNTIRLQSTGQDLANQDQMTVN